MPEIPRFCGIQVVEDFRHPPCDVTHNDQALGSRRKGEPPNSQNRAMIRQKGTLVHRQVEAVLFCTFCSRLGSLAAVHKVMTPQTALTSFGSWKATISRRGLLLLPGVESKNGCTLSSHILSTVWLLFGHEATHSGISDMSKIWYCQH